MLNVPLITFIYGKCKAPEDEESKQFIKLLNDNGVIYHAVNMASDANLSKHLKSLSKKEYKEDEQFPPHLYVEGKWFDQAQLTELIKAGKLNEHIPKSHQKEEIYAKIKKLLADNPVLLFMKGVPDAPQCGFSKRVVNVLKKYKVKFNHFNIFDDFVLKE